MPSPPDASPRRPPCGAARRWTALALGALVLACSGGDRAQRLHEQGELLMRHRRYYAAIEKFEQALAAGPQRPDTLVRCAEACLLTRSPQKAIDYGERALALDPTLEEAALIVGQARLTLAVERGRPGEDGSPKPDAEQTDAVRRLAEGLLGRDPRSVAGRLLLARLDQLDGRLQDAEGRYRALLEDAPEHPQVRSGLADTLLAQRRYGEALEVIRPLATSPAAPPAALRQYALALAMTGRWDEAFAVLEPYVGPPTPDADYQHYAAACAILTAHIDALLRGDRAATTTVALDALPIPAADAAAGGEAAAPAAERSPELAQAIERLDRVSLQMKSAFSTMAEAWFFRGLAFQLRNRMADAIENLHQAAARAPDSKPIRLALALALIQDGRTVLARQELARLLRDHPGDFDARLRMAQCYALEADFGSAQQMLERLLLERPQDPSVRALLGRVLVAGPVDARALERGLQLLAAAGDAAVADDRLLLEAELARRRAREALAARDAEAAREHLRRAAELLDQRLDERPDDGVACMKRIELAMSQGDRLTALYYARQLARLDPRFLPLEARLLLDLGRRDAARTIYERLTTERPGAMGFELALAELTDDDLPLDALETRYADLAARYPDRALPRLRWAEALARRGAYDLAIAAARAAAERFPDDLAVQSRSMEWALRLGRWDDALVAAGARARILEEQLRRSSAPSAADTEAPGQSAALGALRQTEALAALLAGQPALARDRIDQAKRVAPTLVIGSTLVEALAWLQEGEAARAAEGLEAFLDRRPLAPPHAELLAALAIMAADGQTSRALERLRRAPAISPAVRTLFERMLRARPAAELAAAAPSLALFEHCAAWSDLTAAMPALAARLPEPLRAEPYVLARLGEAWGKLDQLDEALACYERMTDAAPDFADGWLARAALLVRLARRDPAGAAERLQAAEQACRRALDLAPDSVYAVEQWADTLLAAGRRNEAIEAYRRLIELDPARSSAYNNLAWNLTLAGRLEEAAAPAAKALELAPDRGAVLDTAGWLAYLTGDAERAERLLRDAAERAPEDPAIRLHLARVLAERGRAGEAARHLRVLAAALPDGPLAAEARELLQRLGVGPQ